MDWIDRYLLFAENTEPMKQFHVWSAISTIASCLQRRCFMKFGHMTIFPNMYVVLIGSTGCRKGTAMRLSTDMLQKLGVNMSSESVTREALIRTLQKASRTDVAKDTGELTWESSLTIHSEEFTVLLGYNNLQMLTDLTDWYDCGKGEAGSWTYETVGRGKEIILGMWVNILGATTPEAMQSSLPMEAIGIGLAGRMIFVYADGIYKKIPFPTLDNKLGEGLYNDLEKMMLIRGSFVVSDDFIDAYVGWYMSGEADKAMPDPRFAGYMRRRAVHILKLSMIVNASRFGNNIVTADDFNKAHGILLNTERLMLHAFSSIGKRPGIDIMTNAMSAIAAEKEVTKSSLARRYYRDVDPETLNGIITSLSSMSFCKIITNEEGQSIIRFIDSPESAKLLTTIGSTGTW